MSTQIPIGVFSKMTRLTPKALRIYEKKGLLVPDRDDFTGYRYYMINQIEIGIKIKMLVNMGFGLKDISDILDAVYNSDTNYLDSVFQQRLHDLQLEIGNLTRIEKIIRHNKPLEVIYMSSTEPVLKEVQKLRVVSKREKGSYDKTIGKIIHELMTEINNSDKNTRIVGPIMFISHDGEYKEQDADIEMAIPITGRISVDSEDIEIKNLESCQMISVLHTGSYSEVGAGYTRIHEFIIKNEYEIVGLSREIYLNDPNRVDEDELLTEIQVPVRKQ